MIERIDVVCTGGRYDDPELGPTPRHPRQKLGRLWVMRTGHIGSLGSRDAVRGCPQCGRRALVAAATANEDQTGYDGGVWQRILDYANAQHPDRRVVVVDISDPVYSW